MYANTCVHTVMPTHNQSMFRSTGLVSADADVALTNSTPPIKKITKDKGWTTHSHTHLNISEDIPLLALI